VQEQGVPRAFPLPISSMRRGRGGRAQAPPLTCSRDLLVQRWQCLSLHKEGIVMCLLQHAVAWRLAGRGCVAAGLAT
jgi:hypothetical protein